MADQKNIFQRMSAITQEISTVAKNLSVDAGKSSYKAVGEADVLAAVKPIEAKHGVYSYPFHREIIDSGEMVSQTKYGERKQLFMRVATVYRFVNVDKPEEFVDIQTYGDGVDTQDKAPGKAMTYGDKYALLKAYKIQTGDDPDQNASEDLSAVNHGKQQKKPEATPVEDRTGQPAYPPIEKIVADIESYMASHDKIKAFMDGQLKQQNARDIHELAFTNEKFLIACWNKWCNKG